jgi:hypothetical protein
VAVVLSPCHQHGDGDAVRGRHRSAAIHFHVFGFSRIEDNKSE